MFGEKYPKKVRVIAFNSDRKKEVMVSKELCGGTHVNSTGQIGVFKILSDSSVSSGVRRIEAITGEEAEKFINKKISMIEDIKMLLKSSDNNIREKIESIKTDLTKLKKESENNIVFSEDKICNSNPQIYFDNIIANSKDLKNFQIKSKIYF